MSCVRVTEDPADSVRSREGPRGEDLIDLHRNPVDLHRKGHHLLRLRGKVLDVRAGDLDQIGIALRQLAARRQEARAQVIPIRRIADEEAQALHGFDETVHGHPGEAGRLGDLFDRPLRTEHIE